VKKGAILWWVSGVVFLLLAVTIFCMVTGILERNIAGLFWNGLYPLLLLVIAAGVVWACVITLRGK